MTREKEIEKASAHRFDEWGEQAHALELAFQAGAMWADSHPHWISVEEKLPNKLEPVLCTNGHDVGVGFYDSDDSGNVLWAAPHMGCFEVTHWMPLPQAPMKGGEQ